MKKVAKKVTTQKKVKKEKVVRAAKFKYEIECREEPVVYYENGKISLLIFQKPKIKAL